MTSSVGERFLHRGRCEQVPGLYEGCAAMNELHLESVVPVLIVASFWIAFLVAAHVVLKHVIHYRITANGGIEVLAFRSLVVSTVRCTDIAGIEVMTFARLVRLSLRSHLFWACRAGNRLVSRRAVVITKRPGAGRALVITPEDPDAFVRDLRGKCPGLGNGGTP